MLLFLKLYLSHLLSDFVLQPDRIAKNKQSPAALLAHAAIYCATAIAIVNVDLGGRVLLAIIALAVGRGLSDYVKARFTRDQWGSFSVDQITQLLLTILAVLWLIPGSFDQTITVLRGVLISPQLYLFLCVYVGAVFGGGYLVQRVTSYFMAKIDKNVAEAKPGLPNAGKYIGWLERTLILTFLITGYPEGIGLLLAAKALARYPEIKEDTKGHFAEYFLIGTLTSVSLALFAGLALIKIKSRF